MFVDKVCTIISDTFF